MNDNKQFSISTELKQAEKQDFLGSPGRSNCLELFARAPVPGRVKTRLSALLGEDGATTFYAAMLQDSLSLGLAALAQSGDGEIVVCYTPHNATKPGPHSLATYWDGAHRPQIGDDLGERMLNAIRDGFEDGAQRVVLIGSDAPDLPPEYIAAAFAQLHRVPLVFGPSGDGGFYLIGAAGTPPPALFTSVPWSTATTLQHVLANAAKLGITTGLLDEWHDVDTEADFHQLRQRLHAAPANLAPATRRWLQNHGYEIGELKTASATSPSHRGE